MGSFGEGWAVWDTRGDGETGCLLRFAVEEVVCVFSVSRRLSRFGKCGFRFVSLDGIGH